MQAIYRADITVDVIELAILGVLKESELHGYELKKRLREVLGPLSSVSFGSLYPALARLEHNGLLEAEWALSDNNRRAKFYTLTAAGRKRLKAETERWNLAALALNKALRAQEI